MIEEWKDIVGYEGLYCISNEGKIKSNYRIDCRNHIRKERLLKPIYDKDGYSLINLYINGCMKTYKIHRLVAKAFIPNPYNLPEVNHKDENKSNNCVSNLEWCDSKYNNTYGTCKQRMATTKKGTFRQSDEAKNKIRKARSIPISQYNLNGEYIGDWPSIKEAQDTLHIYQISKVCRGIYCQSGGYIWKYNNEINTIKNAC